ncbi:hypothetical protein [Prauserella alba]|nr:hypothetical protein [Prauserella alba]
MRVDIRSTAVRTGLAADGIPVGRAVTSGSPPAPDVVSATGRP